MYKRAQVFLLLTVIKSVFNNTYYYPAPSAAPTSVSVSEVTSSSITVQWGAVNGIHRNGDITGYTVRYGVQGNGSIETASVSGGGTTQTIITGLAESTGYSIEMAAVNSAGTGIYSDPIYETTLGTWIGVELYRLQVIPYFQLDIVAR